MLAKIEFFEVYRVLWVLEFVDTDLEDHHLQIKYFTSIKAPASVFALPAFWLEPRAGCALSLHLPACDVIGSVLFLFR